MKTLIFATNNKHKLEEIRAIAGQNIHILSLSEIGFSGEIPETADTIAGNALQKARFIFEKFNLPVFADDTGLEVEALDGAPGVYSARYAGQNASYANNVKKLLKALSGKENRKARFVTVIALVDGNETLLFEGVVNGHITSDIRGDGGFGYDPVFLPDGFEKTFAEMSPDEKNKISHRALATEKLISYLKNL
ncbi:MAG: non-canonical purine NTP diphosphatase [Bacteroidetes bacterium]|nr:non-canonical purine NTP diphosphatase [Bacteroidota bacterium]